MKINPVRNGRRIYKWTNHIRLASLFYLNLTQFVLTVYQATYINQFSNIKVTRPLWYPVILWRFRLNCNCRHPYFVNSARFSNSQLYWQRTELYFHILVSRHVCFMHLCFCVLGWLRQCLSDKLGFPWKRDLYIHVCFSRSFPIHIFEKEHGMPVRHSWSISSLK